MTEWRELCDSHVRKRAQFLAYFFVLLAYMSECVCVCEWRTKTERNLPSSLSTLFFEAGSLKQTQSSQISLARSLLWGIPSLRPSSTGITSGLPRTSHHVN